MQNDPEPIQALTERELRDRWPWIPWDAPLRVYHPQDPGREAYVCRYCIGLTGVRVTAYETMFESPDAHEQHLRDKHGRDPLAQQPKGET